ncbi:flagellar M-ring protein FliF [bacterium]|nr:flagellar M-ring protein FliF [bacterium]
MEQVIERLKEFWSRQNLTGKVMVAGLPLLVIVIGIISISLVARKPVEMALLSSDTESADMAKIVEELKKQGVPMQLKNDGRDVYVPMEQVDDLRFAVTQLDLTGAHIGWELFDKPKWGATQKEIDIAEQRAKEGVLARNIEADERVLRAEVMLNMQEDNAFDEEKHSSASVILTLANNASFGPREAGAVQQLVASAVPNLAPQDVTVTDNLSRMLSADKSGAELLQGSVTEEQLNLKKRYEEELKQKILDSLIAYGPGRVTATVNVELDFSRRTVQSENYSPVVGDRGIERRVTESREKSYGASAGNGGTAGTNSNVPGYSGLEDGGSGSGYSKTDSSVEYEINKEVTESLHAPGTEIKRRSATVTIDVEELAEETRRALETQVATAIGADLSNGDKVSVIGFVFDPAARAAAPESQAQAADAAAAGEHRDQTIRTAASWGIALLMVALLAVMMRSLVNNLLPREPLLAAAGELGRGVELDHDMGGHDDGYVMRHLDDMSDSQTQKMRSEIERLIDNRPEVVAGLVRNWLLED